MIKFEKVVSEENENDITLPKRSTIGSAGYDFFAKEDVIVYPIKQIKEERKIDTDKKLITLVKTGIKAKFDDNMVLKLYNRSSNPGKGLILANGVGVVDSDYYGNPKNDGEIMFAFINILDEPIIIQEGDKIGQGVFEPFFLTDNDNAEGTRNGGFGSTGV